MRHFRLFAVLVLLSAVSRSQLLLKPQDIPTIAKTLETFHGPNSLKCRFLHEEPRLDFSLRWIVTYSANCSASKLEPEEKLVAYLRLQTQGSQPIYFVDPRIADPLISISEGALGGSDASRKQLSPHAIAVGEGEYSVDFLVGSTKGRMFRTQWSFKARFRKNPQLTGLPPNSADVFRPVKWKEKVSPEAPKLTILLHATRLHGSLQGSPILQGYDLATDEESYWLSSLIALLTHVPHKSADVVAFSIEHENEIFRQRNFNEEGYRKLSEALSREEIGKTVVPGAMQSEVLSKFLISLVKEEDSAERDSGRMVAFVGPTAWLSHVEIPKDLKEQVQAAGTRLFYFQYYDPTIFGRNNLESVNTLLIPGQSPDSLPRYPKDGIWKGDKTSDSIDYFMEALGGQILRIHSAEEFRQAIVVAVEQSR